jgi:hypothetical protein
MGYQVFSLLLLGAFSTFLKDKAVEIELYVPALKLPI